VVADDDFGKRLRGHRIAARLSQEELAARSGISVRAISDLERGQTRWPHPGSVERLADGLDLSGTIRAEFIAGASRRLPGTAPGQSPPAGRTPVVPRQLPLTVPAFAGRTSELAALSQVLTRPGGTAVIAAIGGTAGVGKTALALHWARLAAAEFPDGQLYLNLHGFSPAEAPVSPAVAIRVLLEGLDLPPERLPPTEEDQLSLYRSLLVGKRMLIVLDNARDEAQVRPLLPGSPTCRVVVTSRNLLADLTAAHPLVLDVLIESDAWDLLEQRLGPERLHADEDATYTIIKASACLPLALSIVAARAALRPERSIRAIAAELTASHGLDAFTAGEPAADIRAVLSWSFRQLDDGTARVFRLAGLHPGPHLDLHAAAALAGITPGQAEQALLGLVESGLMQLTGPGRYGMHDLLRAYAREQAGAHERTERTGADGPGHQALTRLFDYYRAAAAAVMDVWFPTEAHRRPRIGPSAAAGPAISGKADARTWLDRERANLVAVGVHCADHGWPQHATDLASTLFRYLLTGSHLPEAQTLYDHALRAARRSGDLAAEGAALNSLGSIQTMKGYFPDAVGHYRTALTCYRECGDRVGQARVLHNLALTEHHRHDYRPAAGYYREAVAILQRLGERFAVATVLCSLSGTELELGSLDEASEHLEFALQVFRETRDQLREAEALSRLGTLSLRRGQLAQAAAFHQQALAIQRRIDQPVSVAEELQLLGEVTLRQGDYQQAISYLRRALALFRQTGSEHLETTTLRTLAEALHQAGQPAAARTQLIAALRLAAGTGDTYQQARAHHDLAETHHRVSQDKQARHHWQQALTLYARLGAPEADDVRFRLSSLQTIS
jgi:tetratricopeptide (TPR) repeat protein/transcriptional regulator with XRE-family HTH domain